MIFLSPLLGGGLGKYVWSKADPNKPAIGLTEFTKQSTPLTVVKELNGYRITTGSAGGWGYNYLNSNFVNTDEKPLILTYTIASTGVRKGLFMGFADTEATNYNVIDEALYLSLDGQINHQRNASQVSGYGSANANDVIKMQIYKGTLTVTKNGTQLFNLASTITGNVCCAIVLYTQNTAYGIFACETEVPGLIGYMVSNDENSYPSDNYHTDGFYYTKIAGINENN